MHILCALFAQGPEGRVKGFDPAPMTTGQGVSFDVGRLTGCVGQPFLGTWPSRLQTSGILLQRMPYMHTRVVRGSYSDHVILTGISHHKCLVGSVP